MKININNILMGSAILLTSMSPNSTTAQGNCYSTSGCANYSNFGYNATTAATLEYDNYISTFHATGVRDIDGTIKVWGEGTGPAGTWASSKLIPTAVNPGNYPGLTGTPLKLAMGGRNTNSQNILLTSDNKLWAWGVEDYTVSTDLTSSWAFGQLSVGLPTGVTAANVKMMFAAYQILVLTTCGGDVYALSINASMRGANGAGSATAWSRVQKSTGGFLTNIVAVRGTSRGLFALDASGNLFTWGINIWLGNNTGMTTATRATQMSLPGGNGAIKMIGMTSRNTDAVSTYYVLYENGGLYAMGSNNFRQIGDWTTTDRPTWVQPSYPDATNTAAGAVMNDIKWISPNEHDDVYAVINVLNNDKKIFNWGQESAYSLGRGVHASSSFSTPVNPGEPIDFQSGYSNANIIAVETGGHTTMLLKECVDNFGYIGHRVRGSMGDNNAADATDNIVQFNTSAVQVCGAPTVTATLEPSVVGPYCTTSSLTMIGSPAGGTFAIDATSTATATINATTGALAFTGTGTLRVNYTVSDGVCGLITIDKVFNVESCPSVVTIPGMVWNDANSNAVINSGENGVALGFWANLTDPNGNVVASVRVASDGTYSFVIPTSSLAAAGSFKVVLTTSSKDVGTNVLTADAPPLGVSYTGTNRGATGVNNGNTTGIINLGALNGVAGGTTTNPANFGVIGTPLPVNMLYFTAASKGRTVVLDWATATEQHNMGFDIEHSANTKNWKKVNFVKTQAPDGNSTTLTTYQFIDEEPLMGLSYYRLKQIDIDGKYEFSIIREIKMSEHGDISVHPNPAKDYVIVDGLKGGEHIAIYDATGRIVKSRNAANVSINISLNDLQAGAYYIHITNQEGKLYTRKVFLMK